MVSGMPVFYANQILTLTVMLTVPMLGPLKVILVEVPLPIPVKTITFARETLIVTMMLMEVMLQPLKQILAEAYTKTPAPLPLLRVNGVIISKLAKKF